MLRYMLSTVLCYVAALTSLLVVRVEGVLDVCNPDPCVYGRCSSYQDTFRCDCLIGASGRNCEHAPDMCSFRPCLHGSCKNNVSVRTFNFACVCDEGYTGELCNSVINHCSPDPCDHGTCVNHITGHSCDCNEGYTGNTCSIESDPCLSNPCVFGSCNKMDLLTYKCSCDPNFTGENCDIELDPCLSNPCVLGTCNKTGPFAYTCTCTQGYTGKNCDSVIDHCIPDPCAHGACQNHVTGYSCDCDASYFGQNCSEGLVVVPVVTGLQTEYITVSENDSVLLNCSIENAETYSWIKLDECVPSPADLNQTQYKLLVNVSSTDAGSYLCEGVNPGGSANKTFIVDVKYVHTSTFENWLGDYWHQDSEDSLDWAFLSGQTPTDDTGPLSGHGSDGGYYVFLETSSPTEPGDTASLYHQFIQPNEDTCLSFFYNMFGQDIGTLNVTIEDYCTGEKNVVFSMSGDQGQDWHKAEVSILSSYLKHKYRLRLIGISGSSYLSDIALDDVTISSGICGVDCDFADDTCGWTQSTNDVFDWTRQTRQTSTVFTGPDADHTGQGYYMYTEASNMSENDTADLVSPAIYGDQEFCFTLYTCLYGDGVGSVRVLIQPQNEPGVIPAQLATFNKVSSTPSWVGRNVNIPAQNKPFHIIIRGVLGSTFAGDVAIDDVSLRKGTC